MSQNASALSLEPEATPGGLRERQFNPGYIADEDLASLVWMGLTLERPAAHRCGAAGRR